MGVEEIKMDRGALGSVFKFKSWESFFFHQLIGLKIKLGKSQEAQTLHLKCYTHVILVLCYNFQKLLMLLCRTCTRIRVCISVLASWGKSTVFFPINSIVQLQRGREYLNIERLYQKHQEVSVELLNSFRAIVQLYIN